MNDMIESYRRNLETLRKEREAMVPIQALALREKKRHELEVARASAPTIVVRVYPP